MKKREALSSRFSKSIEDMIAHKVSLGYSRNTYMCPLAKFDRYCARFHPEETHLTSVLVLAWAQREPDESVNSQRRRLSAIREFARYLQSIGISAFVLPPNMTAAQTTYVPHIFTECELAAFFKSADCILPLPQDPLPQYIVPVLFRLMYCCGLRPQESCGIKMEDIDFNTGRLFIREAKRHKERIVMLSPDLLHLFQKFRLIVTQFVPHSEYLFPTMDGDCHNSAWVHRQFGKCWRHTSMLPLPGPKPRPYDFRHTFATRRLHNWLDEGKDLNQCLPYLSAYMGHSDFSSTAYYIHLLPERLHRSHNVDWVAFSNMIPEVSTDEIG